MDSVADNLEEKDKDRNRMGRMGRMERTEKGKVLTIAFILFAAGDPPRPVIAVWTRIILNAAFEVRRSRFDVSPYGDLPICPFTFWMSGDNVVRRVVSTSNVEPRTSNAFSRIIMTPLHCVPDGK
jgi:hypothetical protein